MGAGGAGVVSRSQEQLRGDPWRGQQWKEGLVANCAERAYGGHPSGTFRDGHGNFTEGQESGQAGGQGLG